VSVVTETHVAGCDLEVQGRYLIQRCSWCGAVLLSYDYARIASPTAIESRPSTFRVGGLVRFTYDGVAAFQGVALDRTMMEALDEEMLPDDSCALLLPLEVVAA
jgi:hypothetical protein